VHNTTTSALGDRRVTALPSTFRTPSRARAMSSATLAAAWGLRGLTAMRASTTAARAGKAGGLVAVVYVSEGKTEKIVDTLESTAQEACESHGAKVVNVFRDVEYNRTGFTLGISVPSSSSSPSDGNEPAVVEPLRRVALALTERAMDLVDLRAHAATHPRCGVVDHISCHAVGDAPESIATTLARGLGAHIGSTLGVPVLLYGNASPARAKLADLRRKLGYFRETGVGAGAWAGAHVVDGGRVDADFGPTDIPPERGVVMLGATPWVCNYNVPVVVAGKAPPPGTDPIVAARRLARAVSERGGGLRSVQAMALPHGEDQAGAAVMEIACNLLDADAVGPEAVQAEVERLCGAGAGGGIGEGWDFDVREGYVTNLTPEDILHVLK